MNEAIAEKPASVDTARMIYILYLIGLVIGITSIVGLIMAYINKDEAPDWLKTHYQFQIRSFWISLLYGFISLLLCLILIGFVLFLVIAVWWIVRCVKGLKYVDQRQPVPNPTGWWF